MPGTVKKRRPITHVVYVNRESIGASRARTKLRPWFTQTMGLPGLARAYQVTVAPPLCNVFYLPSEATHRFYFCASVARPASESRCKRNTCTRLSERPNHSQERPPENQSRERRMVVKTVQRSDTKLRGISRLTRGISRLQLLVERRTHTPNTTHCVHAHSVFQSKRVKPTVMQSASLQHTTAVGQTLCIRALTKLLRVKALMTLAHEAASELSVEAIGSLASVPTVGLSRGRERLCGPDLANASASLSVGLATRRRPEGRDAEANLSSEWYAKASRGANLSNHQSTSFSAVAPDSCCAWHASVVTTRAWESRNPVRFTPCPRNTKTSEVLGST